MLPEFLKLFYRPNLPESETTHRDYIDKSAKRVAQTMLVSLLVGMAVTGLGASSKFAPALLWALACSGVGWFLGFLFGIPRSLASDALPQSQPQSIQAQPDQAKPDQAKPDQGQPDQAKPDQAKPDQGQPDQGQPDQGKPDQGKPDQAKLAQPGAHGSTTEVNTNLEQISDWLTKIIVGVTLVEITPAFTRLEQAALLIAKSLGGEMYLSFGYAIMVYFFTSGFLGSYLLTRLYLQLAFGRVGQPPKA